MDRRTIDYYDRNSTSYSDSTEPYLVRASLDEFLSHMKKGARILDCGCGCGRDSRYFLSLGYSVDMIDASKAMCRIAGEYTGVDAVPMDYMDLRPSVLYSGIWAQASLLHERRENLKRAFTILSSCLEDDGVLYASFRYGNGERREGERWYTDMDETSLPGLLPGSLVIVKMWQTSDVRPGYSYRWLNVILRKVKKEVTGAGSLKRRMRASNGIEEPE